MTHGVRGSCWAVQPGDIQCMFIYYLPVESAGRYHASVHHHGAHPGCTPPPMSHPLLVHTVCVNLSTGDGHFITTEGSFRLYMRTPGTGMYLQQEC